MKFWIYNFHMVYLLHNSAASYFWEGSRLLVYYLSYCAAGSEQDYQASVSGRVFPFCCCVQTVFVTCITSYPVVTGPFLGAKEAVI
jgi:hypothetical protein